MGSENVAAHQQSAAHRYTLHYPEHPARESDPHYRDFEHYRRTHVGSAVCDFARRRGGDTSECRGGLELHHSHIEFAVQNGVDLALLERDFPGVSDRENLGTWIESSDANLRFLCAWHHRGHGGVHVASAADYEAAHYVRKLIS